MSKNPEVPALQGQVLVTKYKMGDHLFGMLNDRIVEGIVVGITKGEIALDKKGEPLMTSTYEKVQETYTLSTRTGLWTRTNNVDDLYLSIEELKENIKIILLNE